MPAWCAVLACVAYTNTLDADWTYDDKVAVRGNPDVTRQVSLWDVFTHDFWGNELLFKTGKPNWTHLSYRPLVVLGFQLTHRLVAQEPALYHVCNVLIYALACVLFARLAQAMLGPRRPWAAAVAALAFTLAPVHSEVVANVTTRADAVAAIPLLIGARWVVRHCQSQAGLTWQALLCPSMAVLVGLLCKETALVAPALFAGYYLASELSRLDADEGLGAAVQARNWRAVWTSLRKATAWALVAWWLVFGATLYFVRVQVLTGGYELDAAPVHNPVVRIEHWAPRFASIAYVQALALSMCWFPLYLAHEHNSLPPILHVSDPRNLLTLLVWLVQAGILWAAWRAKPKPGPGHALLQLRWRLLYAWGWMWLTYLPSSHLVLNVGFVLAERTLFFPSMGATLILADIAELLVRLADAHARCMYQALVVRSDAAVQTVQAAAKRVRFDEPSTCADPVHPHSPCASPRDCGSPNAAQEAPAPTPSQTVPSDLSPAACTVPPKLTLQTPARQLMSCMLGAVWLFQLGIILARNRDWVSEESLGLSQLALYPNDNFMAEYGIGCVYAYQLRLEEAKHHLHNAMCVPNIAEPHIMMSQLYWAYPDWAGPAGPLLARQHLNEVIITGRKLEFAGNYGILGLKHGVGETFTNEHAIVAARNFTQLPLLHPNQGLLLNNEACVRWTSAAGLADANRPRELFAAAIDGFPFPFRYAALANLGLWFAVHGRLGEAMQLLRLAQQQYDIVSPTVDFPMLGNYEQVLYNVHHVTQLLHDAHASSIITSWRAGTPQPIAGQIAVDRLRALNATCETAMLWF